MALWMKFTSGQYIISSGGASRFATGFDFYRESAAGDFELILETSTAEWSLKVNDIPKVSPFKYGLKYEFNNQVTLCHW